MARTKEVENFTKVGNPTVANKTASNFSLTNYLMFNGKGNYTSLSNMEIVFHFKTGSTLNGSERLINSSDAASYDSLAAPFVEVSNNDGIKLCYFLGNGYYTTIKANYSTSTNTEYWTKWVSDGSTISGYSSSDGLTWSLVESKTFSPYFKTEEYIVGTRRGSGSNVVTFLGTIYLNDCYIKVNDQIWWQPYIAVPISDGSVEVGNGYYNADGVNKIIFSSPVKKDFEDIGGTKGFKNNVVITLDNSDVSSFILQGVEAGNPTGYKATKALDKFVYLNNNKDKILGDSPKEGLDVSYSLGVNVVGDLRISDGVASNFSATNYIDTGKIFNFHDSDSWEIGSMIIPENLSGARWIFGAAFFVRDNIFPLGWTSNNQFAMLVSYSGTRWDLDAKGSHRIQANTKYWIKYGFDGSSYYFKYSLDGINFIDDIRVSSSTRVVENTSVVLGIGRNAYSSDPTPWINNFFDGSLDLKETYVRTGTNVWTPYNKSVISVSKGYAYSDETTGYLEISDETEYTLQDILVHPEDFEGSTTKTGYLSLANPSGTTKIIATGMRNPTKEYAGSVATPADIAKKITLSEDLSEIKSLEDI